MHIAVGMLRGIGSIERRQRECKLTSRPFGRLAIVFNKPRRISIRAVLGKSPAMRISL